MKIPKNIPAQALSIAFLLAACTDSSTPVTRQTLAPHGAYAADLSINGQYAVISSIHHGLMLWDLYRNQLLYRWSHRGKDNNNVFVTRFSPNGSHVVTATRSDFVIWNVKTGKAAGFYSEPESTIRDIAISSSGRYVLIGRTDGKVEHLDVDTGRRLKFLAHTEQINSVDLSANGRYALTGGNDYSAYLWDTRTAQVIWRFNHASRVSMVKLDPKGKFAFTAGSKRQSIIWNLKTGKEHSRLHYISRQQIYSAIRFANQDRWLLTGSPSRNMTLWDLKSGKRQQSWMVTPGKSTRPDGAVVYSVAYKPQTRTLVSISSSGLAETWKIK
ncbi:WD40 repeat domain-containing protein [Dongshaea marina]|uniref:WD40 repeat domain-containing protein n=1 Tax=Dongshaea marina TaxID=2047966 RepID=UPI000D3E1D3C|nr:hypothetical protein [Dongshaea marina]